MSYFYAGYGSNMNIEQMQWRCPDAKIVGNGYIKGWKLYFNYHANIKRTDNEEDVTPVVIWEISDEDLKQLDRYEGFPRYYIKKTIPCYLDENENDIDCIVYIMSALYSGVYSMPDKRYFNTIYDGYKANKIEIEPLYNAYDYTANRCYINGLEVEQIE